jgi:pimeloyl-ACP methyl ester carboxylesterase
VARQMPQFPGVKHRFVDAGDLKTHVAIAGKGDPVVLLHGWPEHWYAWRSVIPRLAEHHRVIALDLRGFGWTDIAWKGFEKENMADDVIRLLDAMDIERVRIVGHDWGGWIGFLLALRHPERVEQLVAMNTPQPWPRRTPRNFLAARRFAYMFGLAAPFIGQRLQERHPGFIRRVIRRGAAKKDAFTGEDYKIYARDLKSPTRARATALLYRTFLVRELLPVAFGGRYRKARLTTPALLLHGGKDRVVPAQLLGGVERHADDIRVEVVPEAGHYLPEERPDYVADRVLEFFGSAEREAAAAVS